MGRRLRCGLGGLGLGGSGRFDCGVLECFPSGRLCGRWFSTAIGAAVGSSGKSFGWRCQGGSGAPLLRCCPGCIRQTPLLSRSARVWF